VPWPWIEETGIGSPSPSRWNSNASASCPGSSILFAIRKIGFWGRREVGGHGGYPPAHPARVRGYVVVNPNFQDHALGELKRIRALRLVEVGKDRDVANSGGVHERRR